MKNLRSSIFEGLSELLSEISLPYEPSDGVAQDLILPRSAVLTYGASFAVMRLLRQIHRKKRGLKVIVAGGDPEGSASRSATELAREGLCVTYVSSAEVFALMPSVDYVIMGTVSVLSAGSAVTVSGAHIIALTAQRFAKPVFLIAPLYKLAYLPVFDLRERNEMLEPSQHRPELAKLKVSQVSIPMFDVVPGELVTFYITDIGAVHPSSLYTLSKQRYHSDDLHLSIVNCEDDRASHRRVPLF
eukprot:Polyplicarium_translucidae@DN261_c0_g1_i1.p1